MVDIFHDLFVLNFCLWFFCNIPSDITIDILLNRLYRLINKGLFEEAEEFAKIFQQDVEVSHKNN